MVQEAEGWRMVYTEASRPKDAPLGSNNETLILHPVLWVSESEATGSEHIAPPSMFNNQPCPCEAQSLFPTSLRLCWFSNRPLHPTCS